jgi:citrate lyase beta subunit
MTAFPAWLLAQALHYTFAPLRAARADNDAIAHILVYLLEASRRTSLFDIEDAVPIRNAAAALNLMVHMQGVLVWQSDFPAISINDDLRAKLAQLI